MFDELLYDELCIRTSEILSDWKKSFGFAPTNVTAVLDKARLDWLVDLTISLKHWSNVRGDVSEGELLLACSNLGAVVEGWLKFFYVVYLNDYYSDFNNVKKADGKGNYNVVDPNNLSFERLKQYSRGKLWEKGSDWDLWVERVQQKRNAIHAFNNKDIGTIQEFNDDVVKLGELVKHIHSHLPPIEDYIFTSF